MSRANDPKRLAMLRQTERMPSDPSIRAPLPGPQGAAAPAFGPRGTVLVPSSRSRGESEVVIGVGKSPRAEPGAKVDVSRADPRRAPTRKLDRRSEIYLSPDSTVAQDRPPRRGITATTIAYILLAVLAAATIVLVFLAFKQRAPAP